MREAFMAVKGAVSKQDLVPSLSMFLIHDGWVTAFDGRVRITAPAPTLAPLGTLTVPAARMLAAVEACEGREARVERDGARLRITATAFHALIPVGDATTYPPETLADGKKVKLKPGLLHTLSLLRPFIGDDASRPFCASILFDGPLAVATNNVALITASTAFTLPRCAIPVAAVNELLRIDKDPIAIAVADNAQRLTMWYADGTRLTTTTLAAQWPDITPVLDSAHRGARLRAVPDALESAVQRVAPFAPDIKLPLVCFDGTRVRTPDGELSATVDGFEALGEGVYHATPLLATLAVASKADWTRYPRVPWTGEGGERGVLVGVRT